MIPRTADDGSARCATARMQLTAGGQYGKTDKPAQTAAMPAATSHQLCFSRSIEKTPNAIQSEVPELLILKWRTMPTGILRPY